MTLQNEISLRNCSHFTPSDVLLRDYSCFTLRVTFYSRVTLSLLQSYSHFISGLLTFYSEGDALFWGHSHFTPELLTLYSRVTIHSRVTHVLLRSYSRFTPEVLTLYSGVTPALLQGYSQPIRAIPCTGYSWVTPTFLLGYSSLPPSLTQDRPSPSRGDVTAGGGEGAGSRRFGCKLSLIHI